MDIISLIAFSFIGIYFSIAVYHFMVWLGRKQDYSNLFFSLLSLSFFANTIVSILSFEFSSAHLQIVANYLFPAASVCLLPLFGLSTGLITTKMKWYIFIGSSSVAFLGIGSICLLLAGGSKIIADTVFFTVLLLYVVIGNIYNTFSPAARRERRGKKLFWFQCGFVFLVSSLGCCVVLIIVFDLPIDSSITIPFFHVPFILMLLIFEFALANKFNSEHTELNGLKHDLERKVEDRTKELRSANDQKTQFIINFAHETKTPLTLITNHLAEFVKTQGAQADISIVRQYAEKLKHDMVNILDHEKLERGQIFYDHGRIVNVSRLLERHIAFFTQLARHKRIEIAASLQPDVFLKIDPLALESLVNNLLDNAIKYTGRDGRVSVRLEPGEGLVRLTVSDTGPGIPPEEQRTVFEPFYQLSHKKRNVQGIGMGLNIVKKIMDEVKGTIELSSSPGRGTTFTLVFPGVRPEENELIIDEENYFFPSPPAEVWRETEVSDEAPIAGRSTILVVDDQKDIVACLQKGLRAEYNVYCALSGREALEKIETMPKPDAIVSDIMMDDMDGYELFDRLATRGDLASVPLIFLTAITAKSEKLKGIRKGAVDFISKPFHVDELKAKLDSLIKMRNALTKEHLAGLRRRLFHHLEAIRPVSNGRARRRGFSRKTLFDRYGISQQQIAIIALLKGGLLRKEISARLDISINSLNTQIQRIFGKCHVQNKTELLNIFAEGDH